MGTHLPGALQREDADDISGCYIMAVEVAIGPPQYPVCVLPSVSLPDPDHPLLHTPGLAGVPRAGAVARSLLSFSDGTKSSPSSRRHEQWGSGRVQHNDQEGTHPWGGGGAAGEHPQWALGM